MSEVRNLIAHAIKRADRSWFNEDYMKQARSVITELRKAGYAVVPVDPDEETVEAGLESMQAGRHRPSDVVTQLYQAMVQSAKI